MRSISKLADSVGERFGRSDDGTETEPDRAVADGEGARSSLFRCPDCEAVYVAVEKTTCSSCETAVEPIQSTLTDSR